MKFQKKIEIPTTKTIISDSVAKKEFSLPLEQKWNDRPTWQKAVLFIHLALVAAMFGFGIGLNDK